MNPRFWKEIRPLLLPGATGTVAAAMLGRTGLAEGVSVVAVFALFGSIGVLASLPFGVEFQHRTFTALLSQPIDRARLWREKLSKLGLVLGVIAIGGLTSEFISNYRLNEELILPASIALATCASACYWTLTARSIVGGMALNAAAQFLGALGASVFVEQVLGDYSSTAVGAVFIGFDLLCGALFLWLGWRKFGRLEMRDETPGESTALSGWLTGERWWAEWLRCRPSGASRNLFLKEFRLQQPVVMVAVIYFLLWLVTLALQLWRPTQGFEEFSVALTVLYAVVCPLLAGSVSMAEERALGLAAWQLSLPTSAMRQWLVKLMIGAVITLCLGVVLPGLLLCGTAAVTPTSANFFNPAREPELAKGLWSWLGGSAALYLLSFWSVSMGGNVVRAVATAVLAAGCLVGAVLLAVFAAEQTGGVELPLMEWLTRSFFNGSPQVFGIFACSLATPGLVFLIAIVLLIVLRQSLMQFRRAQSQAKDTLFSAGVLLATTCLACFLCADFMVSLGKLGSFPY